MKKLWLAVYIMMSMIIFSGCGTGRKTTGTVNKKKEEGLREKYAEQLGVAPDRIENIELYRFVDEWIGVNYKYGGTDSRGVDCSGFANVLYNNVYNMQLDRMSKDIYKSCRRFGKSKLKEGDLIFFNIKGKKYSHIGIYLQNDKFVHASSSKGVIISDLNNPYCKKYFHKGGRP